MPFHPADAAALQTTAELGQAVVLCIDPDAGQAWCSQTAQAILGHAPAALARDWSGDLALVAESDRSKVARARSGDGPVRMQFGMARGNGAQAVVDAVFSPAPSGHGVVAVLRDVTALVQPDADSAIFDRLSREARFVNCRKRDTVRFGPSMKLVYGIDIEGEWQIPSPFVEHIHPDDRALADHGFYELAQGEEQTVQIEYRLRRGDGSYAMVRERFHTERDAAGAPVTIHSTVTDISDWHEERKRRAVLADVSGAVVIDYAPRTDRMQFSGTVRATLGYAPEDMPRTADAYLELLHPDDRHVLQAALNALRAGEVWSEPLALSYRLRHADGSYVHFLDRSLTITDADGRAEGVIVVLTDVTTLLRDKEELRVSSERLKALAELSKMVVVEFDMDTQQVTWSGALEEQFGFKPEDMPSDPQALINMIEPEDRATNQMLFERLKRGESWTTPVEFGFRTRHRNGQMLHIQKRSVCVLDQDGRVIRVLQVLNDVTDLLQKQNQLLAISEIASDASYEYFHDQGRVVFSHGFKSCFGLDLVGERALPFAWDEHVHPDDVARLQEAFFSFIGGTDTRFNIEYRLRRGDGRWASVVQKTAALRDESGRPKLIIGMVDDVTEQRRTEARLRAAIDSLDSGFALYDEDQRLVLYNRRFVTMNHGLADLIKPGVARADLAAAMFERRLLMVSDRGEHRQGFYAAAPMNMEVTQASGQIYTVRFNQTNGGDWVTLLTDVTEAVNDQRRLRALFEVSADAMFDYDVQRGKIRFDGGFRAQFGHDFQGEYSVPSPWEDTLHPDDVARVTSQRTEFLAGRGARFETEFRMQRADGSWAYVGERAVALRDDSGAAVQVLGAVADLTEQRLLEDKLHAAQKMESIGRISGGIAHDFNNLLAVIMGNGELLAMAASDPAQRESINEIVDACKRGAELTRRLLSFARRSRLAPAKVRSNDLVNGMGQLIARVLPATISLQTSLQAGLWSIRVDPAFLESALLNLVINARDAMPGGGILTIETANQRVTEDYAIERNELLPPGRYVMIAVTDTGEGIARDMLERVVEPFFTTKGPNLGSGLGLSMVDGFVRQSGGLLRIYSEPGVGTTVKLLLPAEPDQGSQGLAASARAPASATPGTLRVLLVEDDPRVRSVVARSLHDAGLTVLEADSGDAALELYHSLTHQPHVLLTDVVMPGKLQGPALAQELKAVQPDLRIIFMSGYANEAAINGNGLRADDEFLMKPIQRQSLLEAIARASRPPR